MYECGGGCRVTDGGGGSSFELLGGKYQMSRYILTFIRATVPGVGEVG